MIRKLLPVILACALIAVTPNRYSARPALDAQVDAILQAMPLDQRIGQLFMVSVYGKGLPDSSNVFLRDMMPGAVALFDYNGSMPQEVTQTINAWQTVATQIGQHVPLLMAIDQEGGPVMRLTQGFTPLPWGAALGAMPTDDARKVGQMAGEELRAVGINMNLAPVVDVRGQTRSQFMERRTFSSDPQVVGDAASAYLLGMGDRGVIGVLKHFPGHGSAEDSHTTLPVVNFTRDYVEAVELLPFKIAIKNGAEAVMVGHLVYPALDPTPGLPASLSPTIIGDVLRRELGFQGLVMTDAMDMGAIVERWTRPAAAVMAIKAGVDLVAAGPNTPMSEQQAMKRAVLDAVQRGELSESRIEEAARRILTLKAKRGLLNWTELDPASADQRVNVQAHQPLVDAIYLDTIAIAQDNAGRLPLKPANQRIAVIFPGVYPSVQRECAAIALPAVAFAYTLNPTDIELQSTRTVARNADVVLIFTFNISDYPGQTDLVNAVPPEKAVVISLQSPYDIEQGIQPAAYVTAFNSYPSAFKAACAVLYGKYPAVGRWTLGQ